MMIERQGVCLRRFEHLITHGAMNITSRTLFYYFSKLSVQNLSFPVAVHRIHKCFLQRPESPTQLLQFL
ncbi:hypothetical protein Bca4012_033837 [Brassica carinata]